MPLNLSRFRSDASVAPSMMTKSNVAVAVWVLALTTLITGTTESMADFIPVQSYSMVNGSGTANFGSYDYFDTTYSGSGNKTAEGTIFNGSGLAQPNPAAMLSGGTGLLTDGVIATQNYSQTPGQYVGWKYIDPTITFNLAANSGVQGISVAVGLSPFVQSYVVDGNVVLGSGLVGPPAVFKLSINGGASTIYTPVASSVTGNSEILTILFPNLVVGDTFALTLERGPLLHDGIFYNNFYNGDPANHIGDPQFYLNAGQPNLEPWLMVSEVSFLSAVPEPSTWVMMIAGFAGLGLAAYRRKTKSAMAMA
jgi:hypothetical protein